MRFIGAGTVKKWRARYDVVWPGPARASGGMDGDTAIREVTVKSGGQTDRNRQDRQDRQDRYRSQKD